MPSLPISVCVPHLPSREVIFESLVRPSILAARPAEVIVDDGEGTASEKRNRAAAKATQPFIFFCDDDIILAPYALERMLKALQREPRPGYAYCDYFTINHPRRGMDVHRAGEFDGNRLKQANYISTMSLIRMKTWRKAGGFDESLTRMQDYDLWLGLWMRHRVAGVHAGGVLFAALYDGSGITNGSAAEFRASRDAVRRKWGVL